MANSANPEINKKIATSALGTLVIATVFFYLGDRYAETLATYPGQIFDHLSDAFLSMWQTIKDAPFALDMTSNSLLFGGACFLIIWMICGVHRKLSFRRRIRFRPLGHFEGRKEV